MLRVSVSARDRPDSLRGAASVTGTEVEIKFDRAMYDLRQCKALGEQYAATMKEMFGIQYETYYHDWSRGGASTDFGNVSPTWALR